MPPNRSACHAIPPLRSKKWACPAESNNRLSKANYFPLLSSSTITRPFDPEQVTIAPV